MESGFRIWIVCIRFRDLDLQPMYLYLNLYGQTLYLMLINECLVRNYCLIPNSASRGVTEIGTKAKVVVNTESSRGKLKL